MAELEKTLAQQISLLATRIGNECKVLHGETAQNAADIVTINGAIDALEKGLEDLEGVVNAQTNIDDANVAATTTYSSSKIVSEITAAKQAVKDELLGGAGEAYDTLLELSELIAGNKSSIEALEAVAAGHVKYTEAQSLTDDQKGIARTNIGAASAADLSALDGRVSTAEGKITALEGKMTTAEGDIDAVEGRMTTAEGKITAAEGKITALEGKMTTAEGDIDALEGRMDTAEGAIDAVEADLAEVKANLGDLATDYVAVFEAALAAE